ncbi:MAG: LysR family transcriptional regulator [Gluconacetobacter diazotrophicus]|nr:LysR family transcriptional regulator [Gluconacetobacter diazotrophicus]
MDEKWNADLLRSFVAVVDAGGVTAAAARLGVTQSSVSQQMRRLEELGGRTLLHRDAGGARPTPEGLALLPYAREAMRALEDAAIHLSRPPLAGTVRLGIAEDVAGTRLPALLGRFRRQHATVRLEIETGLSGVLSDRLERGEFDLVVGKRADPRQNGRVLLREALCWATAPGFETVAAQRPLPLVLHPRPSVTAEAVHAALLRAGIESAVVLLSQGIAGLRAGILAGLGVGAFARRLMPAGLRPLDAGEVGLPPLPELLFGLERRQGMRSPAAEALAALLEAEIGRLPEAE